MLVGAHLGLELCQEGHAVVGTGKFVTHGYGSCPSKSRSLDRWFRGRVKQVELLPIPR